MKKKQIQSKLNFKKTTIVSFTEMQHIMGRSMVNSDTVPISRNDSACQTADDCITQEGQASCLSCTGDDCNTSNTTRTALTDIGCNPMLTDRVCGDH